MNKAIFRVFATLAILSISVSAFADGKAFLSNDQQTYVPTSEHEQRATIAYKNGIEHLILAITLDLKDDEHGVWIFPVLGDANQIKLSLIDKYPQFTGHDLREKVAEKFNTLNLAITATQIWPILAGSFTMAGTSLVGTGSEAEAWGIHAEAVSADSLEELRVYLAGKGTNISINELDAFKNYLNRKHTLIVAWINSKESVQKEFAKFIKTGNRKERCPCIYVKFPTEKPFFPLIPTSTYGNEAIGIFVTVIGHWKSTKDVLYTSYYEQKTLDPNLPPDFVDAIGHSGVPYTVFGSWNITAEKLNADLWLEPAEVKGWVYAKFWDGLPFWIWPAIAVVLLVTLSYVCGGLMGIWVLKSWKDGAKLGLWNLLSIAAFTFAIKYSKETESIKKSAFKYAFFVLDFSIMIAVLSTIIIALLQIPLANKFGGLFLLDGLFMLGISFIIVLVPVAIMLVLIASGKAIYKKFVH